MKKILIVNFLLILLISGCGPEGDRTIYTGEGDNWKVKYTVDVSDQDSQKRTGEITYVGTQSVPEEINYLIESPTVETEGTEVEVIDGTASTGMSLCDNCAVIQKDTEISVTISWAEGTEEIILSN